MSWRRRFRYVEAASLDTFHIRFPDHVGELIVQLGRQLDGLLESDSPDLTRLFPTAYPTDPERDAGYQVFAKDQLIEQRRNSLDVVASTIGKDLLAEDELMAWMTVVNDLRLVLGTRLDVCEDTEEFSPDDPNADAFEIYGFLGHVLSEIVDGLASVLPDEGTEAVRLD